MRDTIFDVKYAPSRRCGDGESDIINAHLVVRTTAKSEPRRVLKVALQAALPGVHVSDQSAEGDATCRNLYVSMPGNDVPAEWAALDAERLYHELARFQYCEYVWPGLAGQVLLFMSFEPSSREFTNYLCALFPGMRTPCAAGHPYGPEVLSVIVPDPAYRDELAGWAFGQWDNKVNQVLTEPWLS